MPRKAAPSAFDMQGKRLTITVVLPKDVGDVFYPHAYSIGQRDPTSHSVLMRQWIEHAVTHRKAAVREYLAVASKARMRPGVGTSLKIAIREVQADHMRQLARQYQVSYAQVAVASIRVGIDNLRGGSVAPSFASLDDKAALLAERLRDPLTGETSPAIAGEVMRALEGAAARRAIADRKAAIVFPGIDAMALALKCDYALVMTGLSQLASEALMLKEDDHDGEA